MSCTANINRQNKLIFFCFYSLKRCNSCIFRFWQGDSVLACYFYFINTDLVPHYVDKLVMGCTKTKMHNIKNWDCFKLKNWFENTRRIIECCIQWIQTIFNYLIRFMCYVDYNNEKRKKRAFCFCFNKKVIIGWIVNFRLRINISHLP